MTREQFVHARGAARFPPLSLVAVALIAVCALAAVVRKGIWYDEAWSVFLARHPERWLYDAHPPLFTFL